MASLNDIVQRVKAHPNIAGTNVTHLPDDDFAFAVGQLIFPCLQELSERVGADSFKKHYALTDPAVATVALGADGSASLATLITTYGLLLDKLHNGEIRHSSSDYPLVSKSGAGPGNYDHIYLHYYLVGTTIFTQSSDNNVTPLTGNLTFAVPRRNALDNLNTNLDGMLVDMLVERLRGAPMKEDAPE